MSEMVVLEWRSDQEQGWAWALWSGPELGLASVLQLAVLRGPSPWAMDQRVEPLGRR